MEQGNGDGVADVEQGNGDSVADCPSSEEVRCSLSIINR